MSCNHDLTSFLEQDTPHTTVLRYRCTRCEEVFSNWPDGVERPPIEARDMTDAEDMALLMRPVRWPIRAKTLDEVERYENDLKIPKHIDHT